MGGLLTCFLLHCVRLLLVVLYDVLLLVVLLLSEVLTLGIVVCLRPRLIALALGPDTLLLLLVVHCYTLPVPLCVSLSALCLSVSLYALCLSVPHFTLVKHVCLTTLYFICQTHVSDNLVYYHTNVKHVCSTITCAILLLVHTVVYVMPSLQFITLGMGRWAACFTRSVFTFGSSASSRVEGINRIIKDRVGSRAQAHDLAAVLDAFEEVQALRGVVSSARTELGNTVRHATASMAVQACEAWLTPHAFRLLCQQDDKHLRGQYLATFVRNDDREGPVFEVTWQEAVQQHAPRTDNRDHVPLDWVTDMGLSESAYYTSPFGSRITTLYSCTCQYPTSMGAGCAHICAVAKQMGVPSLPKDLFHPVWLRPDPSTVSLHSGVVLRGRWSLTHRLEDSTSGRAIGTPVSGSTSDLRHGGSLGEGAAASESNSGSTSDLRHGGSLGEGAAASESRQELPAAPQSIAPGSHREDRANVLPLPEVAELPAAPQSIAPGSHREDRTSVLPLPAVADPLTHESAAGGPALTNPTTARERRRLLATEFACLFDFACHCPHKTLALRMVLRDIQSTMCTDVPLAQAQARLQESVASRILNPPQESTGRVSSKRTKGFLERSQEQTRRQRTAETGSTRLPVYRNLGL
jgi:hypothetical protein